MVSSLACASVLVAMGALSAAGCDDASPQSSARPNTGAAVSGAVRRVSENLGRALTPEPAQTNTADAVRTMPELRVVGESTAARVIAREDAAHQGVQATQTPEGWAMTWGDEGHTRAAFVRADRAGHALSAPVLVHEAQSDEEEVWAPAVAFNGDEFGVAWSDPANGRVQFQHFDANGSARGRASTVHMGLTMPTGTRAIWTGDGYAVAVSVPDGVYFARVDRAGARVGDGLMLVEGERVAGLDELTVTPTGFAVAWHEPEGAQRSVRVSRDGRRIETGAARAGAQVALR